MKLQPPIVPSERELQARHQRLMDWLLYGTELKTPKGHILPDKVHYLNIPEHD